MHAFWAPATELHTPMRILKYYRNYTPKYIQDTNYIVREPLSNPKLKIENISLSIFLSCKLLLVFQYPINDCLNTKQIYFVHVFLRSDSEVRTTMIKQDQHMKS